MYKAVNNYTLSNDISIPCIGAGTWKYKMKLHITQ